MFLEGRFLIIACNIQNHMFLFHKSIFEISQKEVRFLRDVNQDPLGLDYIEIFTN